MTRLSKSLGAFLLAVVVVSREAVSGEWVETKTEQKLADPRDHPLWDEVGLNLDPHPDPNEEHYDNMLYVGRWYHEEHHETVVDASKSGRRVGFEHDNAVKYIFGTSFDEEHKLIHESELLPDQHFEYHEHDLPDRKHPTKTRAQVLQEMRHKKVTAPKKFGHVDTHELDGGVTPTKVVRVDPFFLDVAPVTNKEFGKFVRATYYETEAEKFGWSYVLASFVYDDNDEQQAEVDPEAPSWVVVEGAYWRRPEGPKSTYKLRENHPVVHVSHRDAAEYCKWVGKRLPGEWEWEAAARAGHWGPSNRTLYQWGEDPALAKDYANLWGQGEFPSENHAEDGWRGTSPVKHFPPNPMGFYDMTGNVWEWMRGGQHTDRIVRGGSYVDSADGSVNHAATLGARDTTHGTTTTGNLGFRCAKSPKRRTEYHWVRHDEEVHGTLAVEDRFGHKDAIPMRHWEDQFKFHDDDDEDAPLKRKVVKKRERLMTEL